MPSFGVAARIRVRGSVVGGGMVAEVVAVSEVLRGLDAREGVVEGELDIAQGERTAGRPDIAMAMELVKKRVRWLRGEVWEKVAVGGGAC